jgi:hypothetical protein
MTTTKNTRRRKSQVQSSSEEEDEEDEGSSSASDEEASNDDEEEGSDASSVDEYLSHQQVLRQFELEREGQGRGGLGDHLSSHRRSSNGGGSSRQTSSSGTGRDAFQHLSKFPRILCLPILVTRSLLLSFRGMNLCLVLTSFVVVLIIVVPLLMPLQSR